jgi:hypothetical protein
MNNSDGTGPIRDALDHAEPLKTELQAAQDTLYQLQKNLVHDLNLAFSDAFVHAAATLFEQDGQQYNSLHRNLKAKFVRVSDWERRVKEVVSQRKQERNKATKAAAGAGTSAGITRGSQATRLVETVLQRGVELFHDNQEGAFGTLDLNGHLETYSLASRTFRQLLARIFYEQEQKSISAQALQEAQNLLAAKACFDGAEREVFLRVAEVGGKVYVDLGDVLWRVIEIAPDGWRILSTSPVKFWRARGTLPLSEPQRGGSVSELWSFVNVRREDRALICGWVRGTFSAGPYPVLVLKGEQGAAKSTGSKILKDLIDPRAAALRGSLREVRDLIAAARNTFFVAFDNLSYLPEELADAICRLATGGGFGGRELYTNSDEALFEARRPVLLNAIPDLGAARSDFLDRSIILELPTIEPNNRRDEETFWKEFAVARPRILGGFLEAVALGLKRRPTISLPKLPRMADFALRVVASEPALGLKAGEFMKAYERNQEEATGLALSASPLFEPLKAFIAAKSGNFDGTATELLSQLNLTVDEKTSKARGWPKAPNALTNQLRRLAPNLRRVGISVEWPPRTSGEKTVTIVMGEKGNDDVDGRDDDFPRYSGTGVITEEEGEL